MDLEDARRTFHDVPTVHVATLMPDGTPHVVPLWFVWLPEGLVVTCRVGSRVWRNLRRDPRVAIQVDRGRAWTEQAGVMVRGPARFLSPTEELGKRALSAWFAKYRDELAGSGFAAYTERVREPALFAVDPAEVARWMHAAERPGGRW